MVLKKIDSGVDVFEVLDQEEDTEDSFSNVDDDGRKSPSQVQLALQIPLPQDQDISKDHEEDDDDDDDDDDHRGRKISFRNSIRSIDSLPPLTEIETSISHQPPVSRIEKSIQPISPLRVDDYVDPPISNDHGHGYTTRRLICNIKDKDNGHDVKNAAHILLELSSCTSPNSASYKLSPRPEASNEYKDDTFSSLNFSPSSIDSKLTTRRPSMSPVENSNNIT